MNTNLQNLYLKRNSKIIFNKNNPDELSKSYATAMLANMNSLGFNLSVSAYEKLCEMPSSDIVSLNEQIMPVLKEMIGDNRNYRSFYPNFPKDIMDKSEAELFFNQIVHYVGAFFFFNDKEDATLYLPDEEKKDSLAFMEKHKMKEINVGSEYDFIKSMKNLMESNISLPEYEKENLKTFFTNQKDVRDAIPDKIPNKENLASITKIIIENRPEIAVKILSDYYKTATDVLRLAVALSDGDVSLSSNTKFRKFNKSEQRILLKLLEKDKNLEENMAHNKEKFKVLLKPMHPDEKKNPKVYEAISKLRNNDKIEKYLGKVQEGLLKKDDNVINLLKQRPGIFAEKLNECLRNLNEEKVLTSFESVAKDISIPVLLRVKNYFEHNINDKDFRVFKPKGKPIFCEENNQENLDLEICKKVSEICEKAMEAKFSVKEPLGNVYIDDSIDGYVVPTSMRDKSEGTRFIAEGSEIPAQNDKNFIRFGIWWTNGTKEKDYEHSIDLDMSVTFYDENFKIKSEAAYYSSHKDSFYTRSGDITNGGPSDGQGVAEFIDINKEEMKKNGIKYAIVMVNNYSQNATFNEMKNSSFLIQERKDPFMGKEYEPMATEQKIELNGNCKSTTPAIYDVEKDCFIWVDRQIQNALNNHHALAGITATLYDLTQMKRPELRDLIEMHVRARGNLVDSPEKADTVFALERENIPEYINVITPFDSEKIISEYLDDIYREDSIPKRIKEDLEKVEEIEVSVIEEPEEVIKKSQKENIKNIFNKCEYDEER